MNLYNINNYDNAIISEKIKRECMRQNITVKTMLQELNISKDTVQQMHRYDKTPNYKNIARICDYLDISLDTLLNRTPTPEQPTPPEPLELDRAIEAVATAAGVTPDALKAVLHL